MVREVYSLGVRIHGQNRVNIRASRIQILRWWNDFFGCQMQSLLILAAGTTAVSMLHKPGFRKNTSNEL